MLRPPPEQGPGAERGAASGLVLAAVLRRRVCLAQVGGCAAGVASAGPAVSPMHPPCCLPVGSAAQCREVRWCPLRPCAVLPRWGHRRSVLLHPPESAALPPPCPTLPGPRVGPPVMFVVEGLNVSEASGDVNRTCSVAGCDPDSLLNQASEEGGATWEGMAEGPPCQDRRPAGLSLCQPCPSPLPLTPPLGQVSAAARAPWSSWLATPAASWLDDFLTWASPEIPQCCRAFANGTRCPPPDQPPCGGPAPPQECGECATCFAPGELPGGRPTLAQFQVGPAARAGGRGGSQAAGHCVARLAQVGLLPCCRLCCSGISCESTAGAACSNPDLPLACPRPVAACCPGRRTSYPGSCSRCPLRPAPRGAPGHTATPSRWGTGWGWGRGGRAGPLPGPPCAQACCGDFHLCTACTDSLALPL